MTIGTGCLLDPAWKNVLTAGVQVSIVIALVTEPKLDMGVFTHAARTLTGENPVREVDARPGRSPLADHVKILDNLTDIGNASEVSHIGFIVAGPTYQMGQFLSLAGSLGQLEIKNMSPDARASYVIASLEDWKKAIVWVCSRKKTERVEPAVRKAYNDIQRALKSRGFGGMFEEYRNLDNNDGTEVLRLK